MTHFLTDDGLKFEANSPEEILGVLHSFSYAPERDDHKFMLSYAARVWDGRGLALATDDPQLFVTSLLKHGLLKEIK